MIKMNEKFINSVFVLLSLLLATILFFYLYGSLILNPKKFSWMLQGDSSVHFFGFNFFKNEPFSWPLGKIEHFNAPLGTSVVYTDSLPWIAILLKGLRISGEYQFHGLWILCCFCFQAFSGYFLVKKITGSALRSFLGSMFFVVAPAFIWRGYESTRHYSLLSHFFILSGFYGLIDFHQTQKTRDLFWWLFIFASLGVHFYMSAILITFYFVVLLSAYRTQGKGKTLVYQGVGLLFSCACLMWVLGYFGVSAGSEGFGFYSMNLNSLFNADGYSFVLPKLPQASVAQREGFQFLGLGVILVLGYSLIHLKFRARVSNYLSKLRNPPLIAGFLFLLCLSLSDQISFFQFQIPSEISLFLIAFGLFFIFNRFARLSIKSSTVWGLAIIMGIEIMGPTFRSGGRLGWVLSYGVLVLVMACELPISLLFLALMLQLIDGVPGLRAVRLEHQLAMQRGKQIEESVRLKSEDLFYKGIHKVEVLTQNMRTFNELESLMLERNGEIGPLYVARTDRSHATSYQAHLLEELVSGKLNPTTLYVIDSSQVWNELTHNPQVITREEMGSRLARFRN